MDREVAKGDRPYRIEGTAHIGDKTFHFASGGHGWSMPFTTVEITPDDVGSWGKRHGALGLNHGDDIPDPGGARRKRDGMEIHASNHWASAGCVVFATEKFAEVKSMILGLIKDAGSAWLHVGPGGILIDALKDSPPPDPQEVAVAKKESDPQEKHGEKVAHREHHHSHRYAHREHHRRYARHHHLHYASG